MYNESGDLTGNITITENGVDFKDDLGDFKCALPLGEAYELNNITVNQKLTYRIIQYNGNYYLLSGLKVMDLNEMAFPVVIDPTLNIWSSSSDGEIANINGVYNTAWTATRGTVKDTSGILYMGQSKPRDYVIYRGFVFFNTSSIPENAVIDSATLSLYLNADYSTTDFDITIQNGQPTYPHDPLVDGDYDKSYYSGNGGSLNTNNLVAGYNNISMTEDSWINKTSWTKFCLRSDRDINGISPWGYEYVTFRSADYIGGPAYHPKLVIEYRNQSKIKNIGSTNISGYLLIQVQYNNSGDWVVDNDTINETSPRTINIGEQLALDLIFNGEINTDDLVNGDGTYRVYAAFRDEYGDVLICDDESVLEAWYEFTVDTS